MTYIAVTTRAAQHPSRCTRVLPLLRVNEDPMLRRRPTCLLLLAVLAAGGLVTAPAQARATSAQVFVLHGLPGVVADVVVDGRTRKAHVSQGSVVGPIEVTAGRHTVSLVAEGRPAIAGTVDVDGGGSVDVVAHLPAALGGSPLLTAFPNDLSPVGRGKVRLAVAHTAQVPPADIRVDGAPLLTNVANSEVLSVDVPQRVYSVDIVATGTTSPSFFGPVELSVSAGTLTRVFALGSPADGTMDVLVHRLPLTQQGAAVPSSVQTGDGGQVAALLAAARG